MALVIAPAMADGQVFDMAATALAQGLNVFERGLRWQHVFAAHPAGYDAMQLARHGFIYFVSGESQFAHAAKHSAIKCPMVRMRIIAQSGHFCSHFALRSTTYIQVCPAVDALEQSPSLEEPAGAHSGK
jgi:hypothetical protein